MMTALLAARNILAGENKYRRVWSVNEDGEYHESGRAGGAIRRRFCGGHEVRMEARTNTRQRSQTIRSQFPPTWESSFRLLKFLVSTAKKRIGGFGVHATIPRAAVFADLVSVSCLG